jgi:DNA-binding response OmpR family regulator
MSNQRILIADGDVNRGRRLADALEVAGHACRVATQGAAGLEVALSEHPTVIVAQIDLPLVDARKLAEILRANPRTRTVRFLFLGNRTDTGNGRIQNLCDVSDSNVDSDAGIDEIQSAVEELLERQARVERLEERADTNRDFEGSLSELAPAELLHMLHQRNATGRLTLTPELDDGATPDGSVVLVDGEIVSAATGFVSAEKALFRMLDWRCGVFHFEQTRIEGNVEIRTPTRRVLAEGLRQLEEWNRLAPSLPPLASPVTLRIDRSELPSRIHPLTQEVLALLEEVDRVGDIVDQSSQPDYQVLRTLHTLAEREIIEFGRAHIVPVQPTGYALFYEAQCRRLRGFAAPIGGREPSAASVKVLVAAASPELARQFGELLMKVPGIELTSQFERGGVGPGDLEQIGRIAVDDDFGIDLIHLPRAANVEPIWTFASHRALGTIFLLDSRVTASAADLAPMTSSLSRRAGARTFHVVMLAPGERLSPDELRDNLSLIEEASLFLLPLEPGKDPSSLLRSLFARIVP